MAGCSSGEDSAMMLAASLGRLSSSASGEFSSVSLFIYQVLYICCH